MAHTKKRKGTKLGDFVYWVNDDIKYQKVNPEVKPWYGPHPGMYKDISDVDERYNTMKVRDKDGKWHTITTQEEYEELFKDGEFRDDIPEAYNLHKGRDGKWYQYDTDDYSIYEYKERKKVLIDHPDWEGDYKKFKGMKIGS